jgi:hypothetical protein
MASNNYNPYNSYEQSSAQHYSPYHTAPASNNTAQSSRQYPQPATTQGDDYLSYQTQPYGGQRNGYGTGQDSSWNSGSSYGGSRETTSRAAEALRNMSNTVYTPNNTGAPPSNVTAINTTTSQTARYPTSTSHSTHTQPQQTHGPHAPYAQVQNPSRSINTNPAQQTASRGLAWSATTAGHPSQRAQTMYDQPQQGSASPAQHSYSNSAAIPTASARSGVSTSAVSQPYTNYDRRQLVNSDAPRTIHTTTPSASHNESNPLIAALPEPIASLPSNVPGTYTGHGSTTVDPMAVYDPWPEYRRKQDALKAILAEANRAAEEEAHRAEETRKEEHRRQEALIATGQPKQMSKMVQKQQQNSAEASTAESTAPTGAAEALEVEIRAMMAKMRELNGKDPTLLARIWEEERRTKASPKSPTVQRSTAQPNAADFAQAGQAMQADTPQIANQRKKAATTKSATPVPATPVTQPAQGASSLRHGGNTIWPPEKKTHLASAAAMYLNIQNVNNPVDAARVLSMLDGNPSYIELCEQLEHLGLKLDRAAFAKNLLTAVPDVNGSTRKVAPQPSPVQRAQVPPAVMKNEIAMPARASPTLQLSASSPTNGSPYPPFPNDVLPIATPVLVAEMVPIRSELKPPASKEEAARKRNLSDLVDLTMLSDDEGIGPPPKRLHADSMYTYGSTYPHTEDAMVANSEPVMNNFPVANDPSRAVHIPSSQPAPLPDRELRYKVVVEPLDKRKALRRNTYNPATIARDVLLACGRHPSERQLNQHLDVLRSNLPLIGFESDLSTIKWDILDPGIPPPGYFKDSVQALVEEADDEDDSQDEDKNARPRAQSNAIGDESGAHARVQALPEAVNPFKQKKRGRPARHSFPNDTTPTTPTTPKRSPSTVDMSASAPRSSPASVGYSAFRSATEHGPDGKPLPKKRGRPVGWRKAIHGSASAQAGPSRNSHTGSSAKHQPTQPSSLRNVKSGGDEPIRVDSRSPSVAMRNPHYHSYKCKWQKCAAELHNLETLKKHVFKVHRKETIRNTLECLWVDCSREVTTFDPNTNMKIEKRKPYSFDLESDWQGHIQETHFGPLSWELGDGPASGLSGNED